MMVAPVLWGWEFLVNDVASGDQELSASAVLKDGSIVVTYIDWSKAGSDPSSLDIRARIFNPDGTQKVAEFIVNTTTIGSQYNPDIVVLSDGGFVVAWTDSSVSNGIIRARLFDPAGNAADDDFQLNGTGTSDLDYVSLAALDNGGFTATYAYRNDPDYEIWTRGYTRDGDGKLQAGTERPVGSTTGFMQLDPAIATLTAHTDLLVFSENDNGSGNPMIRARIISRADGGVLKDIAVTNGTSYSGYPAVAVLADGRFVVTWKSETLGPDGITYIDKLEGQIFDANGNPIGATFTLAAGIAGGINPIVALDDGGFAVAFAQISSNAADRSDIHLATFDRDGSRQGSIQVHTVTTDWQAQPSLSKLSDGRLIVTWTDLNPHPDDASGTGVRAQIVDPRAAVVLTGTTGADDFVGTRYGDVLRGAGGHDRLRGEAGSDTLDGGAGADVLDGGDGFDFVSFASSASGVTASLAGASGDGAGETWISIEGIIGSSYTDTLTGNGATQLQGGHGHDMYQVRTGDIVMEDMGAGRDTLLATGSYALALSSEVEVLAFASATGTAGYNLTGSNTDNTITGNRGANILNGEGGNDTISGGSGNDQLKGGSGKDVFVFDTTASRSTNVDKMLDFRYQDDSIYLDNKYFTKLGSGSAAKPKKFNSDMFVEGARAKDREDRIVYDRKTGALYYDQDGTGSKAQVKIATILNKAKLTYHDFFVI